MTISGRKIAVTGGCGFIGSHLVRRLLHEGAAEIRILDSMEFGDPGNVSELSAALRLHTVKLGVARSADLDSILEGVDYLFPLGG